MKVFTIPIREESVTKEIFFFGDQSIIPSRSDRKKDPIKYRRYSDRIGGFSNAPNMKFLFLVITITF
jgi:hypothetical protein